MLIDDRLERAFLAQGRGIFRAQAVQFRCFSSSSAFCFNLAAHSPMRAPSAVRCVIDSKLKRNLPALAPKFSLTTLRERTRLRPPFNEAFDAARSAVMSAPPVLLSHLCRMRPSLMTGLPSSGGTSGSHAAACRRCRSLPFRLAVSTPRCHDVTQQTSRGHVMMHASPMMRKPDIHGGHAGPKARGALPRRLRKRESSAARLDMKNFGGKRGRLRLSFEFDSRQTRLRWVPASARCAARLKQNARKEEATEPGRPARGNMPRPGQEKLRSSRHQ